MHCFYIEAPGAVGEMAALLPDEARHASRVLRMQPGDEVCAMDSAGGRFRAEIAEIDASGVRVKLTGALDSHEAAVRVTVYQGVPKADKLDFIVQKLTELGAASLAPVKMSRCVVKLDEKDGKKRRERLERIAREAAKQCNRGLSPTVCEPMGWTQALRAMAGHDLLLVPWEDARGTRLKDVFARRPRAASVGIVIGPEGGMSAEEVDAMRAIGAIPVTLGPRILRTETAAVVSAALVMQLWGDL